MSTAAKIGTFSDWVGLFNEWREEIGVNHKDISDFKFETLFGAIETIREKSATLDVPVLAMHGSKDLVTPPAGSKELIEAARSTDKTFKSYDGLEADYIHGVIDHSVA